MQQMAKAIALPGRVRPVRYPSFPALERTAVMGFNSTSALTVPPSVNSSSMKVMLMRQASYPFWCEQQYSSALSYAATWILQGKGAHIGTGVYEPMACPMTWSGPGAPVTASATNVGVVYNAVPVGSVANGYPIMGIDNGCGANEFIYAPSGSKVYIVVAKSLSGNMDGRITIEGWENPGQTTPYAYLDITATGALSAGSSFTVSGNRWFRVASVELNFPASALAEALYVSIVVTAGTSNLATSTADMGTITFTAAPSSQLLLFPGASPVEFVNSKLPWYSTRTTAAAVLLTNTTKVMNKEGTVLWGRIAPQVQNVWNVGSNYINTLHPAEKAFLPLESGTYSYCPPSTDMATFWDYTTNSGKVSSVPVLRLDNDSLVNVGFLNDPDGATNLALNVDWHVEFRTSSTLFEIGLSNAPIEALHSAQLALVKSGFFFDNFDHVTMIQRIIAGLASIHPLLSVAAPLAKGLMRSSAASSSIMSKRTKPPSATSASRSGIVGRRRSTAGPASVGNRVVSWVSDQQRRAKPRRGTSASSRSSVASSRKSRRSRKSR